MTIGLCPAFIPGQQYFDNDGNVLAGGLLSCSVVSYTSKSGAFLNTNPIVLDASGRMREEIWLEFGANATFTLKTALGATIGSWSNIYPYNDTKLPIASDVAFNALIGMNDLLPTARYSILGSPRTALPTSYEVDSSYQSGTPNSVIVMVAYPRIFAKSFPAVWMGVNIPANAAYSAPSNYWRYLVYEANANGMPGNSVVDTGIFNLLITNSFIGKTISYTFLPNKIYWFAIAFDAIPAPFQYRTLNRTSLAGKFGQTYETGFVNSNGNDFFLQVPNTVITSPASSLLTNNPPVEVGYYGDGDFTCPVFYLHTA